MRSGVWTTDLRGGRRVCYHCTTMFSLKICEVNMYQCYKNFSCLPSFWHLVSTKHAHFLCIWTHDNRHEQNSIWEKSISLHYKKFKTTIEYTRKCITDYLYVKTTFYIKTALWFPVFTHFTSFYTRSTHWTDFHQSFTEGRSLYYMHFIVC